jgi:pimeloyl-ACP methyl ester carboxylesterase
MLVKEGPRGKLGRKSVSGYGETPPQEGVTGMPAQVANVKIRDVTIKLHRVGRGQPVLFLHGANGLPQWLPFFDALADGYEILVPEHPGFGGSDDPPWIRNVPDLAMFYLDFIEELGLDRFHLIGHSLGGWLAAEIAIRDRSHLQSLTIMSAAGIRVKGLPAGDLFIWGPEETVRSVYYDQALAERMLAVKPTEEQLDILLKNRFTATKFGWQPRWYNPDLEKWLHRLKLPSLVVWGREDKIFPHQYADLWMERMPDARRLVMVEKCGHAPHVEKADEVIPSVRAFLRETSR